MQELAAGIQLHLLLIGQIRTIYPTSVTLKMLQSIQELFHQIMVSMYVGESPNLPDLELPRNFAYNLSPLGALYKNSARFPPNDGLSRVTLQSLQALPKIQLSFVQQFKPAIDTFLDSHNRFVKSSDVGIFKEKVENLPAWMRLRNYFQNHY